MAANTNTSFVPDCGCGRCTFEDCLAKRMAAKVPAWTHPATAGCLSFIREISAGTQVPGLRSTSGALVFLVEQLASMQDSKLDFGILMRDCLDHTSVISTCYKQAKERLESDGVQIPQAFESHTLECSEVLTAIAKVVEKLLKRGRIARFFFAKADREEIARLRLKMDHQMQKFMLFMGAQSYINGLSGANARRSAQGRSPTASPPEAKPPSESDIQFNLEKFSQVIGQHHYGTLMRRHEAEVSNQNTVTNHTHAPITTHGANSPVNVTDAFKTTNHNVQNSNNDYSVSHATYDMRGSGHIVDNSKNWGSSWGRARRRYRNFRSSDSDSDGAQQ